MKELSIHEYPWKTTDANNLLNELKKLRKWINDLQSGMYVNCVYCGHRYGPNDEVPSSMADVLKIHIENCPDHPMSELKKQITELQCGKEI